MYGGSDCLIISGMQRQCRCKEQARAKEQSKLFFRIKYGPVLVQVSQETDLLKRGGGRKPRGREGLQAPPNAHPSSPPLSSWFLEIYFHTLHFSQPPLLALYPPPQHIIFLPATFTTVLYMLFLEKRKMAKYQRGFPPRHYRYI